MSSTLSLLCYVLGDDPTNIFVVDIAPSKIVAHLRDAIKAKNSPKFNDVPANTLRLWKVSIAVDSSFKERIETSNFVDEESLKPIEELSDIFPELPSRKHVHIVVKPPFDGENFPYRAIILLTTRFPAQSQIPRTRSWFSSCLTASNSLYRILVTNKKRSIGEPIPLLTPKRGRSPCSVAELEAAVRQGWTAKRRHVPLPSLEELLGVIEAPLLDSEKIPISKLQFDSLTLSYGTDICTSDDLRSLFVIGEPPLVFVHLLATVSQPAPPTGTEESFRYFWDNNIRLPLELLLPTGRSIRNSNHHTETALLRPDYGFLINQICSFRGEEKGPENSKDPKEELADKFNWVYDNAPYVFGECIDSESVHFLKHFRRLLLQRDCNDPCRYYCTSCQRRQTSYSRLNHPRFAFQNESYRQHTPPR